MKKDKRVNFVVEKPIKSQMEAGAKKFGLSLSQFLIKASLFYAELSPGFIAELEKRAGDMGMKGAVLTQNLVINQVAISGAFEAVTGRKSRNLDRAFRFTNGKLLRDDRLLEELNKEYRQLFHAISEKTVKGQEADEPVFFSNEELELLVGQIPEKIDHMEART